MIDKQNKSKILRNKIVSLNVDLASLCDCELQKSNIESLSVYLPAVFFCDNIEKLLETQSSVCMILGKCEQYCQCDLVEDSKVKGKFEDCIGRLYKLRNELQNCILECVLEKK